MTAGFSFDSDAVARVSRELAGIRSDLQADGRNPGRVEPVDPKPIVAALQEFVVATMRANATLDESVAQVAKWFDDLVNGQLQLDKLLADQANLDQ